MGEQTAGAGTYQARPPGRPEGQRWAENLHCAWVGGCERHGSGGTEECPRRNFAWGRASAVRYCVPEQPCFRTT